MLSVDWRELRPMADRNELLTGKKRKISTVSAFLYLFLCEKSTVVAGVVSREVDKRWESSKPVPQFSMRCECVASA